MFYVNRSKSPINKKFLEQIWRNQEKRIFHKELRTTLKSQKMMMTFTTKESQSLTCYKGIFLCSIKTNTTTYLPSMSQPSFCRIHWSQQNNETYFKGFMVTTNMKVLKKFIRICDMCAQTKDHAINHMIYYN